MSMIGNLLRVTKNELEEYLKDSSLLESRIYNDETDDVDPNLIDIDKSWDGIIFLLTGQNFENSNHPLTRVLFSGQIIDEEQDLGYGPGQYLIPEQVKEVNEQISKISVEELSKKYDAKKMAELEVYPNIWDSEDEVNYLTEYFQTIQEVYAEAAKNDEAIITFIN
ncbi:YfbM family protein [Dyadobacter diqingensis]|uniref:YfbM family protein n=1 Tax=Dyadobacter diqingensis TaxID=2938121 RepID=UPI0020C34217|nr:YfbM family protein [Dyadobacter diqingensis]